MSQLLSDGFSLACRRPSPLSLRPRPTTWPEPVSHSSAPALTEETPVSGRGTGQMAAATAPQRRYFSPRARSVMRTGQERGTLTLKRNGKTE